MRSIGFNALILATTAVWGGRASAAVLYTYTIRDLGVVGNDQASFAGAINASGTVVGQSIAADNSSQVAVSTFGQRLRGLGTAGGTAAGAVALDDAGTAAATGTDAAGNQVAFTVAVANGSRSTLPGFGGSQTTAGGISPTGVVVGQSSYPGDDTFRAFAFTPGAAALTPLDTPAMTGLGGTGAAATSFADGVNAAGRIVGRATTADGTDHAFVYANSAMFDLGTLDKTDGANSTATAVNTAGEIVGASDATVGGVSVTAPFAYTNYTTAGAAPGSTLAGTFTDLGSLGGTNGVANALNTAGQIVGESDDPDGDPRAFLYRPAAGILDLNSVVDPAAGWTLQTATGINDASQITGDGLINGQVHAFLLTPAAVPEPAALSALALVGMFLSTRPRSPAPRPNRR